MRKRYHGGTSATPGVNVIRKTADEQHVDSPGHEIRMPSAPTKHLPGSEGKILAMMERASKRQVLFHPEDGLWRDLDGVTLYKLNMRLPDDGEED